MSVRWLLGLLCICLVGCGQPEGDAEAALEARLQEGVEAVEDGDWSAASDLMAEDFVGSSRMGRQQVLMYARATTTRAGEAHVELGPRTFDVKGDRATVSFRALARGGAMGFSQGRWVQVESGWRMEDGVWKMIRLEWRNPQ